MARGAPVPMAPCSESENCGLRRRGWPRGQGGGTVGEKTLKFFMFCLKRAGISLLSLWTLFTLTFVLMRAVPGDPPLADAA